jgi:predicted enzyme related to lactoylglutathione lyase
MSDPTHHQLGYVEFNVRDMARARRFYSEAFGWQFSDYGPTYSGIRSADGSHETGGLALADEVREGGPLPVLFSTDLEASRGAVIRAGGTVVQDIFPFPGGRRFHLRDPEGNVLAVYSHP